jgi:hypothetical protein
VQLYEQYLKVDPDTKDQFEWLALASNDAVREGHRPRAQLPHTKLLADDPPSNVAPMELLGCTSTRTPDTARTDKQKPP